MKTLICVVTATTIAALSPGVASAADLGMYDDREAIIERPAPVVENERIIERRYYEPEDEYYEEEPVITYYRRPHREFYPYVAAYPYPYRFGPYGYHRHWRHARW